MTPAMLMASVQATRISVLSDASPFFIRQRNAKVAESPKTLCRFSGQLICSRKKNVPKHARAEASVPETAATTISINETRLHTEERPAGDILLKQSYPSGLVQ